MMANYSHPKKAHTSYNRHFTQILLHILPYTCTGERSRCYHIKDNFPAHPSLFISSVVVRACSICALEEVIFHIANTIHLPAGVHTPVEAFPAEVGVT